MRRIYSCYFGGTDWDRLARVLIHTARKHCSGWDVDVRRIVPHVVPNQYGVPGFVANSIKLELWDGVVRAAPDGTKLLLIDTDTMILAPLDDAWDDQFDVAFTSKPPGLRPPFNAGVVFVRVSERVRQFFTAWALANHRMMTDAELFGAWRKVYVGVNQTSLGWLMAECAAERYGVDVIWRPCATWNGEESTWPTWSESPARILHVKGQLAADVLRRRDVPELKALSALWLSAEKEAKMASEVLCASS